MPSAGDSQRLARAPDGTLGILGCPWNISSDGVADERREGLLQWWDLRQQLRRAREVSGTHEKTGEVTGSAEPREIGSSGWTRSR
jgi:hypothetical protein